MAALRPGIGASELPVDRVVGELAARQHGVVSHRQLTALGLGRRAIQHRVEAGRLVRVHRGVYAVGCGALSVNGRRLAAVLACGPGALVSHRPAADQWGVLPTNSGRIDVTLAGTTRMGPAGVIVHRARRLDAADRAEVDGVPVTSVARTLVDLASVVRRERLERAVEEAERRGLLDLWALEPLLVRGRRGSAALRQVLRDYREPRFTRSGLERRFLAVCREAGLPAPATNLWIAGGEADAAWVGQALVVELDSRAFHATRAAFERDRRRDAELQLAGYRVLRVTDARLEREPGEVARDVAALLSRGRGRSARARNRAAASCAGGRATRPG